LFKIKLSDISHAAHAVVISSSVASNIFEDPHLKCRFLKLHDLTLHVYEQVTAIEESGYGSPPQSLPPELGALFALVDKQFGHIRIELKSLRLSHDKTASRVLATVGEGVDLLRISVGLGSAPSLVNQV
jgi:hypothetical protein